MNSKKFSFKPIAMIMLTLSLTACGGWIRSDWQEPEVDLPHQWETQSASSATSSLDGAWWEQFNDPHLNVLIAEVLHTNNDLAAAAIRVRRARLQAGLADTNLTPELSVSGNAGLTRDLNNHSNTRAYNATASVSYELDLWGRLAAIRDAAKWEVEATEYDKQATALSLIGTTSALYWQIAYLHQSMAISQASLDYVARALVMTQAKYSAGKVSKLDVVQAEQSLQTQQADYTQLQQQLVEARHAMAILFDRSPQHRITEQPSLPMYPLPNIPAGVPAQILVHRPDVQAAHKRLRESLANVDQTRASFLPTFTLTSSVGGRSTALSDVLRNPIGTLGAGLLLPFVQWNTAQLSIKVSQSEYAETVINFRQTLYKSLAEVEDSLSAKEHYQVQGQYLAQALHLAKQAESLSQERYKAGKTDMQTWLIQQDLRRKAEILLAQNQLNQLNNSMKIYQALGEA